ncbi:MAG TPA: ABC transporter substrate binding protein, partial [Desulfuromonadaceae bacterium]
ALAATSKVRQTPVIALMALSVHSLNGSRPNVAGIGMFVQPERYMNIFKGMKARRIGVIHNPAKSGWYLRQAQQSAHQAGIELIVRTVQGPRDTLNQLESLAGKVEALWMLPDTTAVTRDTAEAYFRFSQEQRIPVISFAAAYLGLGAAAVVEIDRVELGRQASDLVIGFLTGKDSGASFDYPQKTLIKANQSVLKHLGIHTRHLDLSSFEHGS